MEDFNVAFIVEELVNDVAECLYLSAESIKNVLQFGLLETLA